MEMDPQPGLRDRELGARLRRLRTYAGPCDAAAVPGSRAPRSSSATSTGKTARRSRLAAAGAAPRRSSGAGGRLRADVRLRARVLLAEGVVRRGACEALPRSHAFGPVHPRLPRARDDLRRAASSARPNGMQHAGLVVESSKGEAWPGPARDQLPLRRRADDGRQPRRLQERREGDRAPERLLDHVHGEARSRLDRQLLPRARVASGATARTRSRPGEVFDAFLAGRIACSKELALFLAPTINSYKRFAAGSWAPTTLAWGRDNRTCGFRVVGHGPSSGSRRGSRAATSTRISRSRR